MVFSSLVFLLGFLPALLLVYYLVPARFRGLRNLVLLGASLFFYWWGAGPLVLLMVLSISVNYVGGLLAGQRDRPRLAWAGLLFAVCAGLGLLAWFKYAGFLARTICGLGFAVPIPQVTLPIGISFFTFQGLSYVIDVYRGDAPIQKNPLDTALYVALFPQLVAGPIVRYTTVMEEIAHREETLSEFAAGATRFCFGLSKKMVLANSMGQIADGVFGQTAANLDPGLAWVGALAYTFQIYFDFSAYSDMAIGLGHTFGFHFLENFNYPYLANSITDFWRRWHMSLSSFFRDYVYIPLGGNRKGKARQALNLLIVWFLTGMWHGAGWNFILWGLYYFVFLALEKFLIPGLQRLPAFFAHLYTLAVVFFGWVLFYFTDFTQGWVVLKGLFCLNGNPLVNFEGQNLFLNYLFFLIVAVIACTPLPRILYHRVCSSTNGAAIALGTVLEYLLPVAGLLFSISYLVGDSYNPFLYLQF